MVGKRQFVRLLLEFYFWDLILVWNEPKSTVPTRFELLFHLCPHQSSFQVFQLGRPIDVLVNLCLQQATRNKINDLSFASNKLPIRGKCWFSSVTTFQNNFFLTYQRLNTWLF